MTSKFVDCLDHARYLCYRQRRSISEIAIYARITEHSAPHLTPADAERSTCASREALVSDAAPPRQPPNLLSKLHTPGKGRWRQFWPAAATREPPSAREPHRAWIDGKRPEVDGLTARTATAQSMEQYGTKRQRRVDAASAGGRLLRCAKPLVPIVKSVDTAGSPFSASDHQKPVIGR